MPKNDSCIFCKIIAQKIPSDIVYSDDDFVAFLDIHPTTKGHTLLVPRTHSDSIENLSEKFVGELGMRLRRIAPHIAEAVSASGFNIMLNNGSSAGQVVSHIHWHIIPRYASDGLRPWPAMTATPDDLRKIAETIRQKISSV